MPAAGDSLPAARSYDGSDRACACGRQPAAHDASHEHADSAPTRGTALLLVGDFVHSLVDGALIVAALTVGVVPGAVATVAVAIHEVPRRVAIVTLLLRCGCRPTWALGLAVCAAMGTVLGGTLAWWSAEAIRPALPLALALSAAALLFAAATQSARLIGAWRSRALTLELALPFVAGMLVIGGSHHLSELLG